MVKSHLPDFLAAIKLLIKTTIAKREETIITVTLAIPRLSALPIAPVKGLINPISRRSVKTTATWAKTLFPFLKPGVTASNMIPPKTGIKAVTEGFSDVKYAQAPRVIKTRELIRFARYGFIGICFVLFYFYFIKPILLIRQI